jgi:tRNA-dihydrouridine synthase
MVSSEALTRNRTRTEPLLARAENEKRYGVQLFGADPDTMYRAALLLAPWRPDAVDINCG